MNRFAFRLLTIAFAAVFLFGCAVGRSGLYPDFPERKASYSSVRVYLDVLVDDWRGGEVYSLDLPESRELVASAAEWFRDELGRKGITAQGPIIQSVGLGLAGSDSNPRSLISSVEDREKQVEELPLASPPYFLCDLLAGDEPLRNRLAAVYSTLDDNIKRTRGPNTFLQDVGGMGEGAEGIVFLTIRGYDASFWVRVGQSLKVLPEKFVKHESQVTLRMLLVDSRTGEVVWSKGLLFHQDRMKPSDVHRTVTFLVRARIP